MSFLEIAAGGSARAGEIRVGLRTLLHCLPPASDEDGSEDSFREARRREKQVRIGRRETPLIRRVLDLD